MLIQAQIDFFNEHGFLCLEQVYSPNEIGRMSNELAYLMETFAIWEDGWRGAWRKEYMETEEDQKSVLVYLHELHHYSAEAVGDLLPSEGDEVHHSTLHAKAPGPGRPSRCIRTIRSIRTPRALH